MDGLHDVRLGQAQQVVVALQVLRRILEPLSPEAGFIQRKGLDHGPHGAIEDDDAPAQQALKLSGFAGFSVHVQILTLPGPHGEPGPGRFHGATHRGDRQVLAGKIRSCPPMFN
jgi:hypothetical protein